jgi:hypothetical protein
MNQPRTTTIISSLNEATTVNIDSIRVNNEQSSHTIHDLNNNDIENFGI